MFDNLPIIASLLVFVAVFCGVIAAWTIATSRVPQAMRQLHMLAGLDELDGVTANLASMGFVVFPLCGAIAGMVMFGNPIAVLLAAGLGVLTARVVVRGLVERQHARLEAQLPSAIDRLVQSIRGQVGLAQAVEEMSVALEMPIAGIFRAVNDRRRFMASLDEAFDEVARRQRSDNIRLLLSALAVFARQGGNSVPPLQVMADAFREILRLSEKLKTASSEARASFRLTNSMGILIVIVVGSTQPDLLKVFSTTRVGGICLVVAIAIWLVGVKKMRSLMQVRV